MAEITLDQYLLVSRLIETVTRMESGTVDLNQVSSNAGINIGHMSELIRQWAGTTPDKFFSYLSNRYMRSRVTTQAGFLFEGDLNLRVGGPVATQSPKVILERISDLDYGMRGGDLQIRYNFADSLFGRIMVASTSRGVCQLDFYNDEEYALKRLIAEFPAADCIREADDWQTRAICVFQKGYSGTEEIRLHVRGTDFQVSVWNALLRIPFGGLSTYGEIARDLGKPDASRAVGTAIGSNPVGFLIPCHRVVRASGELGGYRWGVVRKSAMIGWEAARLV